MAIPRKLISIFFLKQNKQTIFTKMKNLKLGMLTLFTALIFIACNPVNTQAQVILKSDSYGFVTDTIGSGETISFTTPANTINAGVEGKYRLHFDMTNISGTSTFKVVVHSRAYAGTGAAYGLHYKNAGTTGIQCDTLQVTAGVPASWDFDLRPIEGTNAGRAVGFKVYFISPVAAQATLIKNVAIITQK
jgi:hypothetical protein